MSETEQQPPAMGGMFLTMFLMLYIIINPGLRVTMGEVAETLLEPRIGFDGAYPAVTILLAGMVMIGGTTVIRHLLVDWQQMAEVQLKMQAYNKALSAARKEGQQARVQKLMKMQPEVLMLQSGMMSNQMRPMVFTMLIAIPIIMWLYEFTAGLPVQALSLPWEPHWELQERLWILPHWIVIYSVMALPFGQILLRGLKLASALPQLRFGQLEAEHE
ncbi:MAG: EMC3/TMCO1 family protein [Candidatus Poseidoniia archaeon]|nr:hypothetical protein [Euryarchaeota archaeon]MDP7135710.1 EMC3/TMCO1 family protein [Candidatus Poseidoniia archaeon]MDP7535230.1 EMC3/TMCO1 family protein [Candidatus Poseidoniia archaeon]MDP7590077.1 EMC3/TMCO1 family protein [Candidatus Poseidoniia archaeon]MDP7607007.1 EMC3/TMCO1 family protein [Candidatus Poseidoniia archaeon]